ncbi:hypothetical protein UFOVP783_116 [uncultured Caudovirales phage]|uniref:Uncharacterized protein n=1 Tax=uncultured Caudovirales phage TaxID=2100421 RepID=A0A6J5NVF3_9CAUD|nr:hypothetical protein UFOVP783_116 [uncultured Caudovirales phage]
MPDEITQFIERHRLDHGYPVLAQTLRSNHLTMQDAWDGLNPHHLVYLATLPNVLSQEELVRFGVWAIREIPDWQDADKDIALTIIEKHAASELTAEAKEARLEAQRVARSIPEPDSRTWALEELALAACLEPGAMHPGRAILQLTDYVRKALGEATIPPHFARWLRAYTTPHLYVTYPPQPTTSGWRVKAPTGKVQALQTQAAPPLLSEPPVRLCCGERHLGPVCPDGKAMCALCHHKFAPEDLNTSADGDTENVCKGCARMESMERVEAAAAEYVTARRAMEGARQELRAATLAYLRKCNTAEECKTLEHTLLRLGVAVEGLHEHVMQRRMDLVLGGGD